MMNDAFFPFNELLRPEIERNATVLVSNKRFIIQMWALRIMLCILQIQIVGPPSVETANFGERMINILANEMTIRMYVF